MAIPRLTICEAITSAQPKEIAEHLSSTVARRLQSIAPRVGSQVVLSFVQSDEFELFQTIGIERIVTQTLPRFDVVSHEVVVGLQRRHLRLVAPYAFNLLLERLTLCLLILAFDQILLEGRFTDGLKQFFSPAT